MMKSGIKESRSLRIIGIAENVFFEKGFSKTSILDICKAANCSRTTLYTYFETKENIFLAVVNKSFDTFLGFFYQLEMNEKTGLDRVLGYAKGYIDFCRKYPKNYSLIMDFYTILRSVDNSELRSDSLHQLAQSSNYENVRANAKLPSGLLIKEIEDGQNDGSINTSLSSSELFLSIWAFLIGITSLTDFSNSNSDIYILDIKMSEIESNTIKNIKKLLV